MRPRAHSAARLLAGVLAAACACITCPRAPAAELDVKSVDIALPEAADVPIVRSVLQTKPGSAYNAGAVAGDLSRLRLLGCAVTKLAVTFNADGVAVALAARQSERPARPFLVSLDFIGGVAAVNDACRSQLNQRVSTLFRKRPIEYYAMLRDAETIEREYRARSYLDARVKSMVIEIGDGESARARIHVDPGRRFTVGKIAVRGNEQVKAAELIEALRIAGGPPWTEMLRYRITDRALRFCRERGCLDARAEIVSEKQPTGKVNVRVELTEGDPYILNNVVVRGAGEFKNDVAKLVPLRRGQAVKESEIDALRRAIEDIGAFTEVETLFVPLRDGPAGHHDLVIHLTKVDLGRKIGDAEKLYYEMAKSIIRIYNKRGTGLKSIKAHGFFTLGGRQIRIDAAVVRPDYAHVSLSNVGGDPSARVSLVRYGNRARFAGIGVPALPALKLAILPADAARGLPTEIQWAPGIVKDQAGSDVILFGERCPPAAAYFTRQAARFAKTPPRLDLDGSLLLPGDSGKVAMKVALGDDKLPRRLTLFDEDGAETARLDVEINPDKIEKAPAHLPADEDPSVGYAVMAPILRSLGLPDAASGLAEEGVARNPKNPAGLAARGLVRLASGPPEPGLADLRKAAELSDHPAYALLLAETLLRAKKFADAGIVCRRLVKADAGQPRDPAADIILGTSISLRSAVDTLVSGPPDYKRRAAVALALAHVGLGEYKEAAELAREMLKGKSDDEQAVELLTRCELGLGNPKGALDTLAKLKPDRDKPQLDTYAALAHHALGDDAKAALALGGAMKKAPALRNLLFLQDRAAEIHARYKDPAARAALARLFSRAAMGALKPEQKAQFAAVVNDAYVLKADVDALARQLAARDDLKNVPPAKVRAAALNQIVEDMLVIRWAMWRGIAVPDEDVYRAMRDEMTRLGAADIAHYGKLLRERGTNLADRPVEIRDSLLKRGAFSMVLSDKVVVRPPEIRAAYEKDTERFKVPPNARLRMITLEFTRFRDKDEAEKLAAALLRRLNAKPETFEQLAREYSHDANAAHGGLWEDVSKASLIDPLDKVVFGLKPGQTSDVVRTKLGCHIVRVETITPERTMPLEEAAPQIIRSIQESKARAEIAAWLKRLKAESYIEIINE